MGDLGSNVVAENIHFRSNTFQNVEFGVNMDNKNRHSYSVFWTLEINIDDQNQEITVTDSNGKEVLKETGGISVELPQYSVDGEVKISYSPYTLRVGDNIRKIYLNKNTKVNL